MQSAHTDSWRKYPPQTTLLIKLKKIDCKNIIDSSKKILNAAIKVGGTTLKDFYSADGSPGYFKFKLNVYGREGLECKKCKKEILKININNRATFFCKGCQS
jgi:formamidopyrimidine-DNA glycosylase